MKSRKFHKIISRLTPGTKRHIRRSFQTAERLRFLLNKHFEGKQTLLAKKMGLSEAAVSKWFNGPQNFTSATLAKLEDAFEETIWHVSADEDSSYVTFECVKSSATQIATRLAVKENGELKRSEPLFEPTSIQSGTITEKAFA